MIQSKANSWPFYGRAPEWRTGVRAQASFRSPKKSKKGGRARVCVCAHQVHCVAHCAAHERVVFLLGRLSVSPRAIVQLVLRSQQRCEQRNGAQDNATDGHAARGQRGKVAERTSWFHSSKFSNSLPSNTFRFSERINPTTFLSSNAPWMLHAKHGAQSEVIRAI